MNTSGDTKSHDIRFARIMALAILVVAPLLYLLVALFLKVEMPQGEAYSGLIFQILMVLAIIDPFLLPLIERFQISLYRTDRQSRMTPSQLYRNNVLIRLCFVEATFLYGLVVCLITGDTGAMLWFYLIGAVWAVVVWPRQARYQRFLERLQRP